MFRPPRNVWIFVVVTLVCVVVATSYVLFSARAGDSISGTGVTPPSAHLSVRLPDTHVPTSDQPVAPSSPPQSPVRRQTPVKASPSVIMLNRRDSPDLGRVEFSGLDSIDDRTTTSLHCERIHFAAHNGICLSREIRLFSAQTIATIVDAGFRPLFSVRTDGIPTRARVSPDGRFAAFTVFVTGHSYADAELSTSTQVVDIAKGVIVANLEEFEVVLDGRTIKAVDFNYWGMTFERNSNFFYATLRTGGVNYLVRGDIKARTVTAIYKGVECPSLSPDETRIAYKKMIARADWRLAVLNLTTFEETPLSETRNVDDQVEWLDNERLLYALVDPAPWMSIMVVSADGSGQPRIFAKGAASPAVVRRADATD